MSTQRPTTNTRRDRHIVNVQDPDAYSTPGERAAYAAGLRALADWVETTPFPIHRSGMKPFLDAQFQVHSGWYDDEGFIKRVGSAARLIGGHVVKGKQEYGSGFMLTRDFGGGVRFRYIITREAVCEAVEVTRSASQTVPVDAEREAALRAELEALETHEINVPITETEYICPDSLLGLENQAASA